MFANEKASQEMNEWSAPPSDVIRSTTEAPRVESRPTATTEKPADTDDKQDQREFSILCRLVLTFS